MRRERSRSLLHLLLTVYCIIAQGVHSQTCNKNGIYRNLYGCEEFDTTQPDYDLIYGTLKTIELADQFRNAAQPDVTPETAATYDFIIIGAGSAGSIIASRLSEIPSISVLLIEAGGEEVFSMSIPLLESLLRTNTSLTTMYPTIKTTKYCLGVPNEQCYLPSGKVMGGTSTINQMIVTRGHPEDYNDWARDGNEGWAYKDLLKYFKKLENMIIPELASDTKNHGTGGPITINYPPYHTPLAEAFMEAGREMGYPRRDYNAEDMIGFSYLQTSMSNGSRVSSNRGYLHSKLRRNLHVTKKSLATKIIIDKSSKRASGVRFVKNGREVVVNARKEVIVSAGAIGSPQLLMLSGIGPAGRLRKLGINVVKDLPVGENFQDHGVFIGVLHTVDQPVSLSSEELFKPGKPYFKDYLMRQEGPFTIVGGSECLFYSDVYQPDRFDVRPNMEQVFFASSLGANSPIISVKGMKEEVAKAFEGLENAHSWSLIQVIQKPKSRGSVRLRTADINDMPVIDPNYLAHKDDLKTLIAGVRQGIEIGRTKAMGRFNSTLFRIDLPACREFEYNSDEYYECLIRQLTIPAYHLGGTCKMGAINDTTAVVNPKLQVIGVGGLRVADASIMPELPAAHTNIPVYMIAEKLSDMVKQHYNLPTD